LTTRAPASFRSHSFPAKRREWHHDDFFGNTVPGHQFRLEWRRGERSGNWHYSSELDMEAWLCPALFRYFAEAPKEIYVQVKSRAANQANH
jgi:hypothetical protein